MTDNVENKLPRIELTPNIESGSEISPGLSRASEREPVIEQVTEVVASAPIALPQPATSPVAIDPVVHSIEKILSEDLLVHFQSMPPDEQAKFKAKGEETVSKLTIIMSKTVVKAKEVLDLIVAWLKLIPGVNKYFLEQESKIKTDKILELHKRQHPDSF